MIGFDDERLARASLTYLAEPSDERLGALVQAHGAAPVLAAIMAGRLPGPPPPAGPARDAARKALKRWETRLGELPTAGKLEQLCRRGIRLACPGDPEWPTRLDDLGAARPYALWLRGVADLRFSCLRSVSIVGSRAATAYGSYVACEIAASIAERGWTVISGAAYGVDGAAHSGALGAEGVTVAVLACGVDMPYPAGHKDLLDAIAENGVVVSEWPPGRNPSRLRFLVRNRVIAALSTGTLVVEAGERSGALNTARHARDLGRELLAVPGPITSEQSRGCHRIIRDWGGALVTSAEDVLDVVTPLGEQSQELPPFPAPGTGERDGGRDGQRRRGRSLAARPSPVLPRDQLDLESAAVLDALPVRGGLGTTEVAAKAGLPPAIVLRLLGELAAGGFAERCERGWRVRQS
ncbi:MAG: DNA-processing protein DprA [Nocardiopsaceae bacterium]|nr:DNA-processing protein DprA [Nocardiopsaceae bacterium]